jgi:phytoene synthase
MELFSYNYHKIIDDLTKKALSTINNTNFKNFESEGINFNQDKINQIFNLYDKIIKGNSYTFYTATNFLPKEKRQAIRALYALCRKSDNIVDSDIDSNSKEKDLNNFFLELKKVYNNVSFDNPFIVSWDYISKKYNIPFGFIEDLFEALRSDLTKTRYSNFEELAKYCYGVGSTVGLMSMYILGFNSLEAVPYAIKLGIGLQLTNILRDIKEDYNRNRIYLPKDEMDYFNVTEYQISKGIVNENWINFMKFQISRANRFYDEGILGINYLNKDSQLSVYISSLLYKYILKEVENRNYDVFKDRVKVSNINKVKIIFRALYSFLIKK